MSDGESLAGRVDAAQSILTTPAALEARRIERALAECSREVVRVMARMEPESGAAALDVAGGVAIFAGAGSPLTQGLAMGLGTPMTAGDLEAFEHHVREGGPGRAQLELCPFADPSLSDLLAARGYRVHEWQLAWTQSVPDTPLAPPPSAIEVRPVRPGDEDAFFHAVMAGFLESEEVPAEALAMMRPLAFAARHELFLALIGGEPIGGGTLAWSDGVAFISGSGVRPAWRRRGAQGALIRARLHRARELGCELACATTLPGTASRRNMERSGFRVAYPKVLMLSER